KDQLANLLGRTATTLDTFINTYQALITVVEQWSSRLQGQKGVVRFTMHPLERAFMTALEARDDLVSLQSGKMTERVPRIGRDTLYRLGQKEGYRDEEIKAALDLLQHRDLVVLKEAYVIKALRKGWNPDDLRGEIAGSQSLLDTLLSYYDHD